MADNVLVTVPTTGVSIAAENISSVEYQRVKLVGGQIGSTEPIPGDSSAGLYVQVKNVPQVAVSSMPAVSGTISVSGPVQVSGAISVSAMPAISGTVSISGPVQVSGTISVSAMPAVSGTVSVANTVPVVMASVGVVSTIVTVLGALVSGTVTVENATTQVSGTVTPIYSTTDHPAFDATGQIVRAVIYGSINTMTPSYQELLVDQSGYLQAVLPNQTTLEPADNATGPIVWLANNRTTLQPAANATGVVVWMANPTVAVSGTVNTVGTVLGTVNVAIVAGGAGGGSVTTAVPSVSATGQVVWVAGGQSTTASPIFVSQINPPAAGGGSVTTAAPSITATGQVMWIAGGQSTTANPVVVTGTVTAGAGTTVISGTVSISGTAVVTIAQTSVIASMSGVVVTTTATSGVAGPIVWLGVGQTLGTVNNVNSISTILGTQVVTIAQTSVVAQVSGTVSALLPGSTTGSSGMSGILVWLGASQTVLVSTQVSGTITITPTTLTVNTAATIAGASVTIQQGASVSAVVSGTVTAVLPGSTTGSSGMSGVLVWLGASQTILISTQISGTVTITPTTLTVNTAATIAGASVTIQQGASVSAVVSGTVSVSGLSVTTAAPSISATGQQMWIVGGQSTTAFPVVITGTVTAGAGTTVVSVSGVAATTTASGLSGVAGMPVWVANPTALTVSVTVSNITVTTVVSGTVSVSNTVVVTGTVGDAFNSTTQVAATGDIVWLAPTQTMAVVSTIGTVLGTAVVTIATAGSITMLDVGRTQILIVVPSTGPVAFATTAAFTVYQGLAQTVAGVGAWVVPAGKTFRIMAMNMAVQNSITTTPVQVRGYVIASGATPTWTSTVPLVAGVFANAPNATAPQAVNCIFENDIPAGNTVGIGLTANTNANIGQIVIAGFLFP